MTPARGLAARAGHAGLPRQVGVAWPAKGAEPPGVTPGRGTSARAGHAGLPRRGRGAGRGRGRGRRAGRRVCGHGPGARAACACSGWRQGLCTPGRPAGALSAVNLDLLGSPRSAADGEGWCLENRAVPSRSVGAPATGTLPPWAAQDLARKARADARLDARVDLVLFFISPLGLRPADLAAMRRLGRRAPVLPVVARVRSHPSAPAHACGEDLAALLSMQSRPGEGCQVHQGATAGPDSLLTRAFALNSCTAAEWA